MTLMAAATAARASDPFAGQLWAFGNNNAAQLGNETNVETQNANLPVPVTLPQGAGRVLEAVAGGSHTLVNTESGDAYAFGWNYHGELGNSTYIEGNGPHGWNPVPALIVLPGQEGPVVQVAGGSDSSFVLTESGQLYAFGNNRFGQLGFEENSGPGPDPSENDHLTPTLVTLPGDEPVAGVAGGAFHTLALGENGQLYAFGKNALGALGNSTNIGSQEANPTPTPVNLPSGAGPIEEFTAGYEDSFVLMSTGRLYSFGWNYFAELGRTANNKTLNPNPVPTVAPMPAGAALETVGTWTSASHTLAVIGMVMTAGSLPVVTEGTPYDAQVEVEGGVAPYEWSAKGLPAGLSVDEASGEVSGTPTATCSQAQCKYSPTFTVAEAGGMEVSRTVAMTLAPKPETPSGGDPGGGGPPPGGSPPVEEGGPAPARLRIGRVHLIAAGAKLWVGGTIVKAASGAVSVKLVAHQGGRRITVSRTARIADGHWRVRLPLAAGRRLGGAARLSASFGGSSEVEHAHAKRRVQFTR